MAHRLTFDILHEYIGLSTEEKPDCAEDGDTFYAVDTRETFIFYNGTWYEC